MMAKNQRRVKQKSKTLSKGLESFDIFVSVATTFTSVTLSVKDIGLVVPTLSSRFARGMTVTI